MRKTMQLAGGAAALMLAATGAVGAQQLTAEINRISEAGVGEKIGTVIISEGKNGTTFKIAVTSIALGKHGFHIHANGDCGAASKAGKMEAGGAAGSHYDPEDKKSHKGPQAAGHKGDLPVLTANAAGIHETVTAPRLKLTDVEGKALVIHDGGDNYSDTPENGGGKGRIACGVIPKG